MRPMAKRTASKVTNLQKKSAKKAAPAKKAASSSRAAAPKVAVPPAPKSKPAYRVRMDKVLAAAREQGADCVLITNPLDVGYLTGFLGGESYLAVGQAVSSKGAVIISDGRYEEELHEQHELCDIIIRKGSMPRAVADVLAQSGLNSCAVQSDHLTIAALDELERALGSRNGKRFLPVGDLVARFRVVKDDYECQLIQSAIKIQEAALLATIPQIKVGQAEIEVASILEAEMKKRGSSKPGFESIIAAKANGSLPHYRPGSPKVTANQPLLVDWGSTFMGYQGDMTRTFAIGKWPAKIKEIYEIVKDAQELSAAALAPGKSTHQIDAIARDYITKHGYGDRFDHGLGHGLGMSKEPPYLNPKFAPIDLQVGHVCTVEPGIYLPGVGGVRIEDQYVITAKGARNFCSLPKTLEWSTLA
jgi:Xaa-Pro aminopeptidase